MASNQCGNCGQVGHFRSECTAAKNESNEYWHAAKAQFRRENPEEMRKINRHKEENRKWQEEGRTIDFEVLNEAVSQCLQDLYDLSKALDVLGRPEEWQEANKRLDELLPFTREVVHNGKGFLFRRRINEIQVDGDIFISRLDDLQDQRDQLVQRVKSLVNGKLGKLALMRTRLRKKPEDLLRYVFEHHPPKRPFKFDEKTLNRSTFRNHAKKALLYYHPDKQVEFDSDWRSLCEAITKILTVALNEA